MPRWCCWNRPQEVAAFEERQRVAEERRAARAKQGEGEGLHKGENGHEAYRA